MTRVTGWMADIGGCGYYRIALPLGHLSDEFTVDMGVTQTSKNLRTCDVIIGQRVVNPGPSRTWKSERLDHAIRIYETDDLLHEITKDNPVYEFFRHDVIKKNNLENMAFSDAVVCSTPKLAQELLDINPNIYVFPNYIDERALSLPKAENEHVTIGWSGGSSHKLDVQVMRNPLKSVLLKNPDIRFKSIGWDPREYLSLPDGQCEHHEWMQGFSAKDPTLNLKINKDLAEAAKTPLDLSQFDGFLNYFQALDFDIGVAPIRKSRFNDSKSWIKVLEYSARGIPSIATNWGQYPDLIVHGETGLLVNSNKEWKEALMFLIEEPDERRKMGEKAKYVASQLTIQQNSWRYEAILEGLTETSGLLEKGPLARSS